jgi:hypothetical protein
MADGYDQISDITISVSMGAFTVQIGDWVALRLNGTVVYGRVLYIVRRRVMGFWDVVTTVGTNAAEEILEVRRVRADRDVRPCDRTETATEGGR